MEIITRFILMEIAGFFLKLVAIEYQNEIKKYSKNTNDS